MVVSLLLSCFRCSAGRTCALYTAAAASTTVAASPCFPRTTAGFCPQCRGHRDAADPGAQLSCSCRACRAASPRLHERPRSGTFQEHPSYAWPALCHLGLHRVSPLGSSTGLGASMGTMLSPSGICLL